MNIETLILLINTISDNTSKLIAKLISTSGLTAEEIRERRDALSADTHATVDKELEKLT